MSWCPQAACHYLNQSWPHSKTPYGITKPKGVYLPALSSCVNKSVWRPVGVTCSSWEHLRTWLARKETWFWQSIPRSTPHWWCRSAWQLRSRTITNGWVISGEVMMFILWVQTEPFCPAGDWLRRNWPLYNGSTVYFQQLCYTSFYGSH